MAKKIDELIEEGDRVKTSCYRATSLGGHFAGEDFDKWLYECKIFVNAHCGDTEIQKQISDAINNAHEIGGGSYNKIMSYLKALRNSKLLGENMNRNKKVFISHCSKNKSITHKFVDLLKRIGLDNDNIYYSSYEETGADYLENCLDSIKKKFEENELLVIFMISKEFYSSNICLAEMGATWVTTEDYIPIILPPFGYSDIKGVMDPMKNSIMLLDQEIDTKLDKLKGALEKFFNIEKGMQLSEWTREKKMFMEEIELYSKAIKPIDTHIEEIKNIDNKIVFKIVANNNTNNRYELEEINVMLKLRDTKEINKDVKDCTIKAIVLPPFEEISFYTYIENDDNLKAFKIAIEESKVTIECSKVK